MHVVAAGVHDRHFDAILIEAAHSARIIQPGGFLDGQPVHVRAEEDNSARSIVKDTNHTGLPDILVYQEAEVMKMTADNPGCPDFLERKFRVRVQIPVELFNVNVHAVHLGDFIEIGVDILPPRPSRAAGCSSTCPPRSPTLSTNEEGLAAPWTPSKAPPGPRARQGPVNKVCAALVHHGQTRILSIIVINDHR